MTTRLRDKADQFHQVIRFLEQQTTDRENLEQFHGLKISRKRPLRVRREDGGYDEYLLNHSFIIVYDKEQNKLIPLLMCPGKPRDELTPEQLGSGAFGSVKVVEGYEPNQTGEARFKKFALKVIDLSLDVAIKNELQQQGYSPDEGLGYLNYLISKLGVFIKQRLFVSGIKREVEALKEVGQLRAFFDTPYAGIIDRILGKIFASEVHKSYMLMDLIPGRSLVEFYQPVTRTQVTLQLPGHDTGSLALALVRGCKEYADKGIVNLDIKPQNLLLSNDSITIIDYGFARKVGEKIINHAGTPDMMAPEVANLGALKDPFAGIFSKILDIILATLGITTDSLELTGKEDVFSLGKVLHDILDYRNATPEIKRLINRTQSTNPHLRPTMTELYTELQRLLPDANPNRYTTATTRAEENLAGVSAPQPAETGITFMQVVKIGGTILVVAGIVASCGLVAVCLLAPGSAPAIAAFMAFDAASAAMTSLVTTLMSSSIMTGLFSFASNHYILTSVAAYWAIETGSSLYQCRTGSDDIAKPEYFSEVMPRSPVVRFSSLTHSTGSSSSSSSSSNTSRQSESGQHTGSTTPLRV